MFQRGSGRRAARFLFLENKKQKDFCQTREVLTLACSDVGGLALTSVTLATRIKTFAPPASGSLTVAIFRGYWATRTQRGARSFCQRERCTSSKFCESTRAPSRGTALVLSFSLTHWFDFSFPCSQMEWRVCKRGHTRI